MTRARAGAGGGVGGGTGGAEEGSGRRRNPQNAAAGLGGGSIFPSLSCFHPRVVRDCLIPDRLSLFSFTCGFISLFMLELVFEMLAYC